MTFLRPTNASTKGLETATSEHLKLRRAAYHACHSPSNSTSLETNTETNRNANNHTSGQPVTLVWFRRDLRVHDNPALTHACQTGRPVVALFLDQTTQWQQHGMGQGRLNRIQQSVASLQHQLAIRYIPLLVLSAPRFSDTQAVFRGIIHTLNAHELCFNIEYEVNERQRDRQIAHYCQSHHIRCSRFHDQCLIPPGEVLTQSGAPFKVFTPFKRAWLDKAQNVSIEPLPAPVPLSAQQQDSVRFLFSDTATENPKAERPDRPQQEVLCHQQLNDFIDAQATRYHDQRDFPDLDSTSRLSIPLALGLLSPRQCLFSAWQANSGRFQDGQPGLDSWINELIWREFYRHVAVAFPDVCKHRAFKPHTEYVAWRNNESEFQAWCEGQTGYPMVDAAQRQLRETGWMHNRLRMISAMFLTKHLLIDWRWGEAHFAHHLLDIDFASNNGGWQWSASTGADGVPYFRIFNPITQAQRFDPDGAFIARYVPELADLTAKSRHFPRPKERTATGYPQAIVDHKLARERALAAFAVLSQPSLSAQPQTKPPTRSALMDEPSTLPLFQSVTREEH